MPRSSPKSIRSARRSGLHAAYQARARKNSNIWLVYSCKTKRDWLISGDHQLIHWIIYLETDPKVKDYKYLMDVDKCLGERVLVDPDAFVTYHDGSQEYHAILSGKQPQTDHVRVDDLISPGFRCFTLEELKSHGRLASRWLRVLSFATGVRDLECSQVQNTLLYVANNLQSGNVGQLLDEAETFEQYMTLGVMAQLAILGYLRLDLAPHSFGRATKWAVK